MARAQLIYTLLDEEGDAIPNRAVTFTKMDGSALGQSLYATESGGAPEVTHVTDSVGMLFRYADTATRALATPSGGAARSVQFDPDPGAILLSSDTNLIYRNTASALDQYAGVDDYVLTIQPTSGGATGNKAFKVENNSGTTVLEIAAKGGGDAQVATYHNTNVGPFVVSPVRNWDTGADMFVNAVKLTGNPTGSHQVANFSYQTVAQPSDGFNGVANVPDHVVANFDYFAQNVASGASQNHDGSGRAIEIQTLVYASTGKKRTMGAMSAGIHTAVDQISGVDVILAGSGTADTEYGSVGIYVHNGDQSAYTGFGTTVRGNMGFLTWGGYGYKQPYVALDTDNSLLWCIDKFGDSYSGDLYPRPGGSFSVGSASRVWADAHIGTVVHSNGSAANPTAALLGAGASSDGLFGDAAGGVVGVSTGGVERFRVTATTTRVLSQGATTLGQFQIGRTAVDMTLGVAGSAGQLLAGSAQGDTVFRSESQKLLMGSGAAEAITITATGSVVLGTAALATTATAGFLYIPTCAGTPTGVPTAHTGRVAILFDTTANKLWVYDGGWLATAALA